MYKMPKECMGFQIEECGTCAGNPKYVTQGFDHEGHSYQISIILDIQRILHAYDDDVWYSPKTPVEFAILEDGKFYEPMDVTWELIDSDLELGNVMHKFLEELLTIL
jgi:hypothetical protein